MTASADHRKRSEAPFSNTLREFRAVLSRVTDLLDRGDATQIATAPLALFIQQRVGCSIVSFWSLLSEDGNAVMRRIGGFDGVVDAALMAPLVRPAAEFKLKQLAEAGICIVARPTATDTASELPSDAARESSSGFAGEIASEGADQRPADDTFIPASIDTTIAANGETFGIIRCEFLGPPRVWRLAETTLLRSFAGEIALRRARRRARWG